MSPWLAAYSLSLWVNLRFAIELLFKQQAEFIMLYINSNGSFYMRPQEQ